MRGGVGKERGEGVGVGKKEQSSTEGGKAWGSRGGQSQAGHGLTWPWN